MKLSDSEKKILRQVRRERNSVNRYDFWFVYYFYINCGKCLKKATGWEGGYTLSLNEHFRNKYSIQKNRHLVMNW